MRKDKQFVFETKVLDAQNRIIEMIGTTENYDRVGDRMIMAGALLENYLKNPVVIRAHDYDDEAGAVAKSLDVNVLGSKMVFKIQFAETQTGKDWYYLYANKYMNASSIGFIPLDYTPNTKGGYDFTKWELLELSLVAVPCNPEAIQRAYEEGHISKSLYEDITKKRNGENEMTVEEMRAAIAEALKPITDKVKILEDAKAKSDDKVKELEGKLSAKTGASLSQENAKKLADICKGLKDHADSLEKFIKDCTGQKDDLTGDDGDGDEGKGKKPEGTKGEDDFTEDDVMKLVQENLKKYVK